MTAVAVLALVVGLQSSAPSERHRVFLEDVAHFLLTDAQRDRFVTLETDALRSEFIDVFWSVHDRAEHIERVRASDRLFGPRGRWSERGRVYQRLGPPSSREDLSRAGNRLVPTELWHYTGVEIAFLPDSFYLVFFRSGGAGRFRLWNPATDTIAALIGAAEPNRLRLGGDSDVAQIDPELALAVDSLVPGGGPRETQSLLASVDAFAELAERERSFGADVRVAVSTRELPSRLVADVWRDDVGVAELHYAVELAPAATSDLRWREREPGRAHLRVTLVGRLVAAGAERERWEDSLELDVSDRERTALVTTRLIVQGARLLHESDERLEVALVTDDAGVVLAAPVAPAPSLSDPAESLSRADAFFAGLEASVYPARVLDRSRTPLEEGRYRFARGLVLARDGATQRAIGEMEASIALAENDVRVHLELARLLYSQQRYVEVLSRLQAVEPRFDSEVDVFVLMAGAAEALGRYPASVGYYERALQLEPESGAIAAALDRVRQDRQMRRD